MNDYGQLRLAFGLQYKGAWLKSEGKGEGKMRVYTWKALRGAKSLVDRLPMKPIAWGIIGSAINSPMPHDVDVCVVYAQAEEWMIDRKVWLRGWTIPFDMFFFPCSHQGARESAILGFGWRGDTEDFVAPDPDIIRELTY